MKFNDLRVAHKLWSVILGLLLLMLTAAFSTQMYGRKLTERTEALVQQYGNATATATSWRGLAELAVTMSMASFVSTDAKLKEVFKKAQVSMFQMTKLVGAHLK